MTRRLAHGRSRPVPEDIANLESLELRVTWEYLGHDPPLNCRRTLDQFGYPSLRDTNARDDDQMLYKLTKQDIPRRPFVGKSWSDEETIKSLVQRYSVGTKLLHETIENQKEAASSDSENEHEERLRDGNLLMVDQLWLWAIDTTTLTTFFPKRESRPSEGALFQQADLRNSVYNELNGDLTGRCENALDLAAFVALHAVTVLLDRSSHPDLEIFRIFEEAIGILVSLLRLGPFLNLEADKTLLPDRTNDMEAQAVPHADLQGCRLRRGAPRRGERKVDQEAPQARDRAGRAGKPREHVRPDGAARHGGRAQDADEALRDADDHARQDARDILGRWPQGHHAQRARVPGGGTGEAG